MIKNINLSNLEILSLQNLKYFPVHYLHFFCICVTKLVENRHLHYVFKQWRGIARTEVISLRILKKSLTQNFWSVNYKNTLNISKTFCFCILKNAATCFHFHTPTFCLDRKYSGNIYGIGWCIVLEHMKID